MFHTYGYQLGPIIEREYRLPPCDIASVTLQEWSGEEKKMEKEKEKESVEVEMEKYLQDVKQKVSKYCRVHIAHSSMVYLEFSSPPISPLVYVYMHS